MGASSSTARATNGSAPVIHRIWESVGLTLSTASYGPFMSVRKRLDHVMNQSFVADLGYPADRSAVARVVLGLQLLADEIDAIAARANQDLLSPVVPEHGETDSGAETALSPEPAREAASSTRAACGSPTGHGPPIGLE